jgi:hypothetical protein
MKRRLSCFLSKSNRIAVLSFFSPLLAVAFFSGCGDPDGGMRVWGEVTYDSEPVAEGVILLTPEAGHAAPTAGGLIKNGRYDMPAMKGPRAGVTYRVSIEGLKKTGKKIVSPQDPDGADEKNQFIPPEYNSRSMLKITVSKQAPENQKDFSLEKPEKLEPPVGSGS